MARGNAQASGAAGQSNSNANAFFGNSNSLYSNLAPQLESQAANPQGFNPTDLAGMKTDALQAAGGSQAAAVGAGDLAAARTRNMGGFGKAVSDASRGAGETLSRNLLTINNENAQQKQRQRDTAISGLEGLYGTNVGATNQALGNVAPLVNADTNAQNASWDAFNNITGALTGAAKSASGFKGIGA